MILYQVRTTFLGAGSPSHFYFDTIGKAEAFLDNCINGEIKKVSIVPDGCFAFNTLNYSDGCSLDDLCYGRFGLFNLVEIN